MRTTEEERTRAVTEFLSQGAGAMSMREFAAKKGYRYYTFRDWVRDYRYRHKHGTEGAFEEKI